ncbi:MAG: GspE/PulE family protein [Candidatus Falkowbacteria bacterium]
MLVTNSKLHELLVDRGYISEADFNAAITRAEAEKSSVEEALFGADLIHDDQLGRLVADDFGYRFIELKRENIDQEVFALIPESMAVSRGIVALGHDGDSFKVGMRNPDDLETISLIEKRLGGPIIPYYITARDFEDSVFKYKSGLSGEFKGIIKTLKDKNTKREVKDELIVKIVNILLTYGYKDNASDVHIEPYASKIVIRFRVDGVMSDVLEIPKELAEFIVARIKILAKLRIDEHQTAQDGKFRYDVGGEVFDVRVSILPVSNGENVVMRLLSAKNRQIGLLDLGLAEKDLNKVKKMAAFPHGMILAVGPTGAGKTSTLYSILKILNTRDVHISTIEDPIEYNIEGISQIQVNAKAKLTFAKGLRSILRQDPDVIMVGEIRDEETADIAINSALTGHLVLSTLHTNNAVTSVPRLIDMKIQPFILASTMNLVIAQRLVRKICETCRESYVADDATVELIHTDPLVEEILKNTGHKDFKKIRFYRGAGCRACNNSGYTGRIGVFEVLEISPKIKDLISKQASDDEIMVVAKSEGMTTMLEDGVNKALNGLVSLEEVIKNVKE